MALSAKLAALALAGTMALTLGACDKNRDEMRPDLDTVLKENGLQSRDLREMTDRMAPDLLQIPEITQNPTRITVVVKGVENKTETEPGRNMDIFVMRLAGLLNSSAARDRILFVEERKTTARMQNEELGNNDPFEERSRGNAPPDQAIRPQFFLYGTISSMNNGRTTYYLCDFKLTSSATGAIVWNHQYETRTLNVR